MPKLNMVKASHSHPLPWRVYDVYYEGGGKWPDRRIAMIDGDIVLTKNVHGEDPIYDSVARLEEEVRAGHIRICARTAEEVAQDASRGESVVHAAAKGALGAQDANSLIARAESLVTEAIVHGRELGGSLDGIDPALRYVVRAATLGVLSDLAATLRAVAEHEARNGRERELLGDVAEEIERRLAQG